MYNTFSNIHRHNKSKSKFISLDIKEHKSKIISGGKGSSQRQEMGWDSPNGTHFFEKKKRI